MSTAQIKECIPVGCVLPTEVVGGREKGERVWGVSVHGGLFDRDLHPLPEDRLTHASENITLPQTSFAGDNNCHFLDVPCKKDSICETGMYKIYKFTLHL